MELKLTAGMNSRAQGVSALLQAFLAALVLASSMPSAKAQGENGVMATYIEYNANSPSVNWDLFKVSASCADLNGANPLKWRSLYQWTAFCGTAGPHGDGACGMCLQVTNVATGASATVRIVDDCGNINGGESLGMDTPVFKQIDNNGSGMADGQLEVNYQFVNCND